MTPLLTKEDDPIKPPLPPSPPPQNECCFVDIFPMPIKSCNVMQKSQAKWMNLFQSDFVEP